MSDIEGQTVPLVAIVDDELDIVTYLSLALEDHGFRVVTISDSDGALEKLAAVRPDLICLDLLMPKRTGVALYAEILCHEQLRNCPVVIMSGLTSEDQLPIVLREAGNLPQPMCFLEKPIKIERLLEVLRRHLRVEQGAAT